MKLIFFVMISDGDKYFLLAFLFVVVILFDLIFDFYYFFSLCLFVVYT
jgi:hypothetical protein